ncbi:MAG: peptidylprolyl isomerase [Paludibacteraceae bacterium]|nr:peptidylprolyl isomerase [Paludibacteraceae bacterium]
MKKLIFSMMAVLAMTSVMAEDEVLMTIAGKPVTTSEFLYIYEKNNQETGVESKSLDEYVDLFVNFKLKVAEAESRGIDTTQEFIKELAGYRAQATGKYMVDSAAFDSLVVMSYERMKHPRRAAHIAIQCPMGSTDSAQAVALAKIEEARVRVTTGLTVTKTVKRKTKTIQQPKEDFYAVAREVSTDPGVQENHGELGWITVFRYVYPFEDAVYNTPVGEVTPIFRTAYGYHIALVEEEGTAKEVNASHIMKMVPRDNANAEATQKEAIEAIYERVLAGEDFATLARELSDDKGSAINGGELGWFGKGMMVKEFEQTAFSMETNSVSAPFRTNFGWHIIYKTAERDLMPLDSLRTQIERSVNRDERHKEMDKSFIRKARAEYNLPAEMSDEEVRAYADQHLEAKYPEFNALVREYHDGILLFDVSLEEVWDKAAQDSIGLTKYFKEHKKNYTWDKPHFKGYLVRCQDENVAKVAKAIIKSADKDSVQSYLTQRLNTDSTKVVTCVYGLWEQGKNAMVDKFGLNQKDVEVPADETYPVVFTIGKKLKAPQEYTDVRSQVVTDYQDYLEKAWIQQLRAKYEVVIDENVLNKVKQQVSAR